MYELPLTDWYKSLVWSIPCSSDVDPNNEVSDNTHQCGGSWSTPYINLATAGDYMTAQKAALALSGGGFRGLLFHLGSVWRLNEFGLLPRIDTISGVSGGAILTAVLGLHWSKLNFNSEGVSPEFKYVIAGQIQNLCSGTLDLIPTLVNSVLSNLGMSSIRVSRKYGKILFGTARIEDLPDDGPIFVINSCDLRSGQPFLFSNDQEGEVGNNWAACRKVSLADAVAASSAFPPFLSPVIVHLSDTNAGEYETPGHNTGKSRGLRMVLSDGAMIDPLGLRSVWDNHSVLFVSDATTMQAEWPKPSSNWFRQLNRCILIQCDASSIRVRDMLRNELKSEASNCHRGAYWCNADAIALHEVEMPLATDSITTRDLGSMRTRLDKFTSREQGLLINWGYAHCDAALRSSGYEPKVDPSWPVEEWSLA